MSTNPNIYTAEEIKQFDSPQAFTQEQRNTYFELGDEAMGYFKSLRSPLSRLDFVLLLGYFRAGGRFYSPTSYHARDIQYVVKNFRLHQLAADAKGQKLKTLRKRLGGANASRHKEAILSIERWSEMSDDNMLALQQFCKRQAQKHMDPAQMIKALVNFCWESRWVVPVYSTVAGIVSTCSREYDEDLFAIVGKHLDLAAQKQLIRLFHETLNGASYVSQLRYIEQSTRTRDMQKNAKILKELRDLFFQYLPVYEELNLNEQAVAYYAGWVSRAKTHQLKQLSDKRQQCLYLLGFIQQQYFERHDHAMKSIIKVARQTWNAANKLANDHHIKESDKALSAITEVVSAQKQLTELMQDILAITEDPKLTDARKTELIRNRTLSLLNNQDQGFEDKAQIVDTYLAEGKSKMRFYAELARLSNGLLKKTAATVRLLELDEVDTQQGLFDAVVAYQKKNPAKLHALTDIERAAISTEDGINNELYAVILFRKMNTAIRAGKLNLKYSLEYRRLQTYLIDDETWLSQKDILIEEAGLTKYQEIDTYLQKLEEQLHDKYQTVNERLIAGENGYMRPYPNGRFRVQTPATDYQQTKFVSNQLLMEGTIPVLQVLREINDLIPFLPSLTHYSKRNAMLKLNPDTAFAGVMALGCNIGPRRMASMSEGIKEGSLVDMIDWRFTRENLIKANRIITDAIDELPLSNVYTVKNNQLRSSSDGKKVTVAVNSIIANHSFKYYGRESGVAVYNFVDEKQRLFHATVFSSSDREAAYMLDGFAYNNPSQQRVHSTDTHGYTHAIFAASHLMDIAFAPRIKGIESATLSAFKTKSVFKRKGYLLLPSHKIKTGLIMENWDDILRFMATIKLGITTASQLFQRLNSYSGDHPLYSALKEFGRIIKSQFLLSYYDDVELRQQIQKQLNIVEQSNRFHDAVFWDRGQQFYVGTKAEQEKYTLCRSLIQNSIILWNYLMLSTQVLDEDNKEHRKAMLEDISKGSVLSWRHVNFNGVYDFSKKPKSRQRFNLNRIQQLEVTR